MRFNKFRVSLLDVAGFVVVAVVFSPELALAVFGALFVLCLLAD